MARHRPTAYCALCRTELRPENRSQEHIIPNAIGGRKKTSTFICRDCNSRTGNGCDAALAAELAVFGVMFDIRRDREPDVPASVMLVNSDGQKIVVEAGGGIRVPMTGSPVTASTLPDGRTNYNIRVPDRRYARQALNGLRRKIPELDVEKTLQQMVEEKGVIRGQMKWSINEKFENAESFRSVLKMCLSLAAEAELIRFVQQGVLDYVRGSQNPPTSGILLSQNIVHPRDEDTVFHCVSISSDRARRLLFGYVELFSLYRFVVVLSDAYDGPEIEPITYAIDPVAGKQVTLHVDIRGAKLDLQQLADGVYAPIRNWETQARHIGFLAMVKRRNSERRAVLNEIVGESWAEAGFKIGDIVTTEGVRAFSTLFAQKVVEHVLKFPGFLVPSKAGLSVRAWENLTKP